MTDKENRLPAVVGHGTQEVEDEGRVLQIEFARGFAAKGDLVNAFAAVNYAHGWLDAGARLGVFDVGGDNRLFTLLE